MTEYKHFISLGYFCSVALETERMGLRSCSSPFDWTISLQFKGVERCIRDKFQDFLKYENLVQNRELRYVYKDLQYEIEFYHDFDQYRPLKEQVENVKEKYNRRIQRFYKDITEPTLFIRYINTGHEMSDFVYIKENFNNINELIKNYNEANNILFVANDEFLEGGELPNLYLVKKDENDTVARKFLEKNSKLKAFFEQQAELNEEFKANKIFFEKKEKKKALSKGKKKAVNILKKKLLKEYVHTSQYSYKQ